MHRLAIILNGLACVAAALVVAAGPGADGRYGLLAPSGRDAAAIAAAAGARIVSVSPDGRFAVAWSSDLDLREKLLSKGASLVFNPAFAIGCQS